MSFPLRVTAARAARVERSLARKLGRPQSITPERAFRLLARYDVLRPLLYEFSGVLFRERIAPLEEQVRGAFAEAASLGM